MGANLATRGASRPMPKAQVSPADKGLERERVMDGKDVNNVIKRAAGAIRDEIKRAEDNPSNLAETLRNESFQRTFTDEYLFNRKPRPREPVKPDPSWKVLAERK